LRALRTEESLEPRRDLPFGGGLTDEESRHAGHNDQDWGDGEQREIRQRSPELRSAIGRPIRIGAPEQRGDLTRSHRAEHTQLAPDAVGVLPLDRGIHATVNGCVVSLAHTSDDSAHTSKVEFKLSDLYSGQPRIRSHV
jgi:hypothetical protein